MGLPAGCFSLLQGAGYVLGGALVRHPLTQAVAFTGSLKGGRALFDIASSRPVPIPFYGEMGSVNPVFVLPGALEQRAAQIAENYVGSVTLGVGQFCTNPAIVLGAPWCWAGSVCPDRLRSRCQVGTRHHASSRHLQGLRGWQ